MRPSTIWYTLKQGVKNIKRNWMFSLASIITMAACIFLFGIFFSIVNNVNNIAHKVEQEVPITVFFEEGTTNKQIKAIGKKIKAAGGIADFNDAREFVLLGADRLGTSRLVEQAKKKGGDLDAEI
jgi:cell division protein FtsX